MTDPDSGKRPERTAPDTRPASPTPRAPATLRRRWHHGRRLLVAFAWTVGVLWGVVGVAGMVLHWGILTHIERWRPDIEREASALLGAPVRIGEVQARPGGWVPTFELHDVRVYDPNQREALRLPRVSVALSPKSLLAFAPRLEQLLIEGAQLEARLDAKGRLYVGGLDFSRPTSSSDSTAALDWFFEQGEFVVRGGSLRWTDERHARPTLELADVSLVLRNGLRTHDWRLDATPPADWGSRFTLQGRFRQPLLARAGDWQRWSGQAEANLPRADLKALRRHVNLPFELTEGEGALHAWLGVRDGRLRDVTADVALRAVELRLSPELQPLSLQSVQGRITAARAADGVTLAVRQLGFTTGEGLRWPTGDVTLALRQRDAATEQPVTGGDFHAERLDLDVMAQIAERLPLGEAVRRSLAELAPRGQAQQVALHWSGPADVPDRYTASGRLEGLTLAARPAAAPEGLGRPGLRDADVDVKADERGGTARLSMRNGAIDLPGVFAEALVPLDRLDTDLAWTITPAANAASAPPALSLTVKSATFTNADAQGSFKARWHTGAGEGAAARGSRLPGVLDLDGTLERGSVARVARYLPLAMNGAIRRYVGRGFSAGSIASASFRVHGDLWDFPYFGNAPGEFRIAMKLQGATYAYLPSIEAGSEEAAFESPWPVLTQLQGDLILDRDSLAWHNARARLNGIDFTGVEGGIAHLDDSAAVTVQGLGRGALSDMLRYVQVTPLAAMIGDSLAPLTATGAGELRLALSVPLADANATTVKGSVTLAGNDVRTRPGVPLLGAARGRVDFTQHGFAVVGGTARVLGGDASFEGGTGADGRLRFVGQGVVTADGLRRETEVPLLPRLATVLSGQTAYRLNLGFNHGASEINFTSTLIGLAADLPPPLRKAADQPLPLRLQTQVSGEPGALRDAVRVDLGNVIHAQYSRDLSHDTPRVLRGGIGIYENAPTPERGVAAVATLASLDVDDWKAVVATLAPPSDAVGESGPYLPDRIALRVQDAQAGTRRATHLVAGLSVDDRTWRANVNADEFGGYVEVRPARAGGSAGRVYARLARLTLPPSDADAVDTLLDQAPTSVPALDVVVDDFDLGGARLGKVEIEALNRGAAGDVPAEAGGTAPREWRLSRLNISNPEAQFNASGTWAAPSAGSPGGTRRTSLGFRLDVNDSGALLQRLGIDRAVRGARGRLIGQVAWVGSPLVPDVRSLSGQINVEMAAGQFLKVDPGASRLLSVLSLQSLPRRLVLDFRDVFQEGFAFDAIEGDVRLDQGLARTNNLRLRGVQAAVLMEGQADIDRETQDLRVVVVPEINAGTASLAYAAINPAIGLGTFLAQLFLRKPLTQAGTREFHISGPWADPKVERIERTAEGAKPPGASGGGNGAIRE